MTPGFRARRRRFAEARKPPPGSGAPAAAPVTPGPMAEPVVARSPSGVVAEAAGAAAGPLRG
ncbi:hypothetical protein, partial [Streptomyces roseolus]|uniref:hypothetical protein n=1 Tax=Streptomyces roseolus TaxID=67358 RepID=UPI00364A7D69